MKVSDLMTRDVCSCRSDATLNDAARIMWEHDCGSVPVLDANNEHVVGIVTDRDIAMAAYINGQLLSSIPVVQVMSRDLKTCKPGDTLEAAERAMAEAHVRRLPVVDSEGRLIGLFSLAQVARAVDRQEHDSAQDERSSLDRSNVRDHRLAAELGDTLSRICISRRAPLDTF